MKKHENLSDVIGWVILETLLIVVTIGVVFSSILFLSSERANFTGGLILGLFIGGCILGLIRTTWELVEHKIILHYAFAFLSVIMLAVAVHGILSTANPKFKLVNFKLPALNWPWKKQIPEPEVLEKVYTAEEWVLRVAELADAEIISPPEPGAMEKHESVIGTNCREAIIEPFPEICEFTWLNPVLREFALDLKEYDPVTGKTGLVIWNYEGGYLYFYKDYGPGDWFKIGPTKPKWIIYFDGKIYLINQDGNLWHHRSEMTFTRTKATVYLF